MQADVTTLLRRWNDGDAGARDELVPIVYRELRRRAAGFLKRERRDHTLQPTALVHEAFLKLVGQHSPHWQNRDQFFGVASQIMRRILVDHARAHKVLKRAGDRARVTLCEDAGRADPRSIDVLDLDRALSRLHAIDPRKASLAELRFFGGLTLHEAARTLDISMATAERDWQAARAWLFAAVRGTERT